MQKEYWKYIFNNFLVAVIATLQQMMLLLDPNLQRFKAELYELMGNGIVWALEQANWKQRDLIKLYD